MRTLSQTVPTRGDEDRRLKILQESAILDSSTTDPSFDRYTTLCRRLFNVSRQKKTIDFENFNFKKTFFRFLFLLFLWLMKTVFGSNQIVGLR